MGNRGSKSRLVDKSYKIDNNLSQSVKEQRVDGTGYI